MSIREIHSKNTSFPLNTPRGSLSSGSLESLSTQTFVVKHKENYQRKSSSSKDVPHSPTHDPRSLVLKDSIKNENSLSPKNGTNLLHEKKILQTPNLKVIYKLQTAQTDGSINEPGFLKKFNRNHPKIGMILSTVFFNVLIIPSVAFGIGVGLGLALLSCALIGVGYTLKAIAGVGVGVYQFLKAFAWPTLKYLLKPGYTHKQFNEEVLQTLKASLLSFKIALLNSLVVVGRIVLAAGALASGVLIFVSFIEKAFLGFLFLIPRLCSQKMDDLYVKCSGGLMGLFIDLLYSVLIIRFLESGNDAQEASDQAYLLEKVSPLEKFFKKASFKDDVGYGPGVTRSQGKAFIALVSKLFIERGVESFKELRKEKGLDETSKLDLKALDLQKENVRQSLEKILEDELEIVFGKDLSFEGHLDLSCLDSKNLDKVKIDVSTEGKIIDAISKSISIKFS